MCNNNKTISFNGLNDDEKCRIMMYRTARQFKSSVPIEEMTIIPSKIGDWVEYCNITINSIKLQDIIKKYNLIDNSPVKLNDQCMITARGDKFISKQIPFVVNNSFACELYLKLILLENNIDFKNLKGRNGHNLWKLYNKAKSILKNDLDEISSFKEYECKIKNISEAFIKWRYIYEKSEEIDSLDFIFLNNFCTYLDKKTKHLILINHGYNVEKDIL